jgi:hypothetical protein
VDPVQFTEERPHPARLLGNLHAEELFDREDEDELVVLERDVVDPGCVRDPLPVRLGLHVLLEARVEVADHRLQADDALAVQVDDQSEDAVRRGVVRPEVDLEDVPRLAEGGIDLEHGRDRRGDARALVDLRPGGDRHYSASEKRTGSPPSG